MSAIQSKTGVASELFAGGSPTKSCVSLATGSSNTGVSFEPQDSFVKIRRGCVSAKSLIIHVLLHLCL